VREALLVRVRMLAGGSGRDRGAAVAEFAMISVLPDRKLRHLTQVLRQVALIAICARSEASDQVTEIIGR
jgi:hypothetical protein